MERRMRLAGKTVPEPIKWPSIAAASHELRRPRHLRVVPAPADAPPVRLLRADTSLERARR
jgi:hypothetical protein